MSDAPFAGAGEVRPAHRFDSDRLAAWMHDHVPGFDGPLTVRQFKGGQSNPTYQLITPGRTYVLRRKPPGLLLKGAHAVEREARVLTALGTVGFAVPYVHGLCTDDAVIGTWFYVMDMVEGRIFWDPTLPELPRQERAAIFDSMNALLARLHAFDPGALGLLDFGRTGNYFQRQIERWGSQYEADAEAGRDPNMDRLLAWLRTNIPDDEATRLVHGDYRIDNIIFAPDSARILAVLDWELATLGHPLADFAYHLMMYRMPRLTIPGLQGSDLAALGLPSEADYVAAYCRRVGRDGIADLPFYLAFNFFRFAAICHGIRGRMIRGTASSPDAAKLAGDMAEIARIGWAQLPEAGASSQ